MSRAHIVNVLKHAKRIEGKSHMFDSASRSLTEFVQRCQGKTAQEANIKCAVSLSISKKPTTPVLSVEWNNEKLIQHTSGYSVDELFDEPQFHVTSSGATSVDDPD